MFNQKQAYKRISKLLLLLLLGVFAAGIAANKYNLINLDLLFCDKSKFFYINKELACGDAPVVKKQAYAELKSVLEDFIQTKIKENEVSEVAIYFRDLENGPTLGINEHADFAPASLLKVPIMITYLSLAEQERELLEKTLKFRQLKEIDFLRQSIIPKNSIKENTPYTIRELIKYMIAYSDNNAYFTLVQYLNQAYPDGGPFFDTMRGLGIIQPSDISENNLTVKSYASIFVQLYHSSFFERKETSEMALSLLADTDFHKGIEAGLPSGIESAHKFGERAFEEDLKQLHDCGIVYYPDNPYLLCIMTRGNDLDKLSDAIASISKMVYEEFDSRKI